MRANRLVGVPYTDDEISNGIAAAHKQALAIATEITTQGGPENLEGKQIVAVIAYLQRLGTDISKPEPGSVEAEAGPAEAVATANETIVAAEVSP